MLLLDHISLVPEPACGEKESGLGTRLKPCHLLLRHYHMPPRGSYYSLVRSPRGRLKWPENKATAISASKGCELVIRCRKTPMHCLTVVWKRCRDGALPLCWPLLSCIIPFLFAYFLVCHPFIFRWRQKTMRLGGANDLCACISMHMLEECGGMLPQEISCSEIASEANFGPKPLYSYHCYLYVFACMTLICIDVHMPCSGRCWRVQTSGFPVLSTI